MFLLLACSAPDTGPRDSDSEPAFVVGTEAQYQLLEALSDRYWALEAAYGADDARVQLEAEVASWTGLAGGGFAGDGVSLVVAYSEGGWGLVGTEDPAVVSPASSPAAPPVPPAAPRTASAARAPASQAGCDPAWTCPAHHSIRMYDTLSGTSEPDVYWTGKLYQRLLDLGFDPSDIELVQRTSPEAMISPEGIFDTRGAGFVFYSGHGGNIDIPWGPEGFWFQLTGSGDFWSEIPADRVDDYDGIRTELLATAVFSTVGADGKLDGSSREVVVSSAAFAQIAEVDEGTMLFFTSCNSVGATDDMLAGGFESAITWDGKSNQRGAPDVYVAVLEAMLGGATQAEALATLSLDDLTTEHGGLATLSSTGKDQYFPAWGELAINPTVVPEGTDHLELFVPGPDGGQTFSDLQPGDTVSVDGVAPVPMVATLRMLRSDGTVIETQAFPLDLDPGGGADVDLAAGASIGLTLVADPTTVEADGATPATITATVRSYADGDLDEPTGPALECADVEFDTDFGDWVGQNTASTSGDGTAAVQLTSAEPGTATIHALLPELMVEAVAPVTVRFGGYLAARTGGIWPEYNPWFSDRVNQIQDAVFVIDADGNEVCYGTWLGWINSDASGCAECTSAWFFSFEGFSELGGDCAPFGYSEGEVQDQRGYGLGADGSLYVWDGADWVAFGTYDTSYVEYEGETFTYHGYVTDWGDLAW